MPLDDLARVEDLEERLGRELTAAEKPRATALLRDASAAVRAATGQQFTLGSSTWRTQVRGRDLLLAQRPVLEVVSVTRVADSSSVGFTWDGLQTLCLGSPSSYDTFERDYAPTFVVDVEYSHGYDTIPDAVVAVTVDASLRAFSVPVEDAGVSQTSLGSYSESRSVTSQEWAAAGAVTILDAEVDLLAPFAFRPTPARTGWA